jgi:hypothetical protein
MSLPAPSRRALTGAPIHLPQLLPREARGATVSRWLEHGAVLGAVHDASRRFAVAFGHH